MITMTFENVCAMLDALENDCWYELRDGNLLNVTFNDFEGFDENWSEIMRDYDDPEGVEKFLDQLAQNAAFIDGSLYHTYYFDNFSVKIGYTSFDI